LFLDGESACGSDIVAHPPPSQIAVIGGGPAGLMAAEVLANAGAGVTVYDRMPTLGRKFLLAGRGGLNLTHSEPLDTLLGRYGPAAEPYLRPAIEAFPQEALRAWCEALGQPTFIGSSGRVFPVAMKASPLLRAWLQRLAASGVAFMPRHRWDGWNPDGSLLFAAPEGRVAVRPDATVLALGGASWPHLGSDGGWTAPLVEAGVDVAPLRPANCGFIAPWSDVFASRFEGQPLKNVGLSGAGVSGRGEALITRNGLQGTGIYALSAALRDAIAAEGETILRIDLRPDMPAEALAKRIAEGRGKQSQSNLLRKAAKLPPQAIGLLHEAALGAGQRLAAMHPGEVAALIKAVPVRLTGPAPIARAISTAGGITFDALTEDFMLRNRPGVFAAGEMLDWEAPTGGYLLQACFATGAAAARGALRWLDAGTGRDAEGIPR
jgi:uncharacterized flavoprotein (TIGR03862 family)